jgi:serine/threonine protein kinase
MDWMATSSNSIPRAESPPRLTETTSSEPNPIHFVPQSEAPNNASPSQLLALFVALAAEINASPSIRDNNALENLVNKDVGLSNIHTAFVGNGSSFSVRVWRLEEPDQSLVFKSAMPSNHKFTHRDEKRRLADVILELRTLSHPALRGRENIVQLLGLGWETDSFEQGRKWPVLILEYAHGGTLKDFLQKSHVSSQAKLHICQDIACGLAALHDVGVIHGDVKPENVLMFQQNSTTGRDNSWVAKLGDFGGAVLDLAGGSDILRTGTRPWNGPKWRKPLRPDDMMKTDIYSFGLVIFNIATDGIEFFSTKAGIFSFPANCVDLQERIMFLQNLKQDGSSFLAKLVEAGYSGRVRGMNGHLLEHLLGCTVQFVANLRSIEDVIATLEKETGRFAAPVPLKKWQRNPKTLADELVSRSETTSLNRIFAAFWG